MFAFHYSVHRFTACNGVFTPVLDQTGGFLADKDPPVVLVILLSLLWLPAGRCARSVTLSPTIMI